MGPKHGGFSWRYYAHTILMQINNEMFAGLDTFLFSTGHKENISANELKTNLEKTSNRSCQ